MSMGRRVLFSIRTFLAGVLLMAAAGCGFQLRGAYNLPYEALFVSVPEGSVVGAGLKRHILASGGTRLVDDPKKAQATFLRAGEKRDTLILSLSASGRVREKRLRYQYAYRIVDANGRDLVPQGYVELTRDVTYSDSASLAKTQEEDLLWRDMENDLVQQLMRRLATAKPKPPVEAD